MGIGDLMKILVTGGAGFIGNYMVGKLLSAGNNVVVYDNLVLGKREYLESYEEHSQFQFIKADLLDMPQLMDAMQGIELVCHLAANSDISYGATHTDVDLKNGTLATYNVLEAMRLCGVKKIIFASSSAIYGDTGGGFAIPENYGPLLPISLYGASKLACEALITAFCHNFSMQAWIYRFANIVGINGTHGAIVDFIAKLRNDNTVLEILGNGQQAKPYLHVSDCVDGIIYGYAHSNEEINYFNLGVEGATNVTRIAEIVRSEMELPSAKFVYTGGNRGWVGDVPQVRFDIRKLTTLGWCAAYSSDEAVRLAVREQLGKGGL